MVIIFVFLSKDICNSSFQSLYISLRLMLPTLFPARHDFSTVRNLVHIRGPTAASYLHQAAMLHVMHREFSPLSSNALSRASRDGYTKKSKGFFPLSLLRLCFGGGRQLKQSLLWVNTRSASTGLHDTVPFPCHFHHRRAVLWAYSPNYFVQNEL